MAKEDTGKMAVTDKMTAEVTYHPDDGDPIKTEWAGIKFVGNIPVSVPLTKTIMAPIRKQFQNTADGTLQSRSTEHPMSIVELARNNPKFSVNGERAERKEPLQRLPTDADQYRGYALRWIRESTTLAQLNERWRGEVELRERCGCEDKDENYLMPFLNARRDQVKEAA